MFSDGFVPLDVNIKTVCHMLLPPVCCYLTPNLSSTLFTNTVGLLHQQGGAHTGLHLSKLQMIYPQNKQLSVSIDFTWTDEVNGNRTDTAWIDGTRQIWHEMIEIKEIKVSSRSVSLRTTDVVESSGNTWTK